MINPLIAYLHLLREIPDEDAAVVLDHFDYREYREGDLLFPGNKVCNELFFVCKGVVRIMSTNDKGMEVTHFFYKENHFCTIVQSFEEGTPSEAGIQACCDAAALVISKQKLLALYQQLPYIKPLIDEAIRQRMMEKVRIRNSYIGEDAETQYKLFIMQQPDIALRVPLKDIASFLGITPQSLSRIRKNLR